MKRFLSEAEEQNFPVFMICAAYQELDGSWRFRTRVDGQSSEVIGALHALTTMLTPEDLQALVHLIVTERPEIGQFRQLNNLPTNGLVN